MPWPKDCNLQAEQQQPPHMPGGGPAGEGALLRRCCVLVYMLQFSRRCFRQGSNEGVGSCDASCLSPSRPHTCVSIIARPLRTAASVTRRRPAVVHPRRRTRVSTAAARHHGRRSREAASPSAPSAPTAAAVALLVPRRNAIAALLAGLALGGRPAAVPVPAAAPGAALAAAAGAALVVSPASVNSRC